MLKAIIAGLLLATATPTFAEARAAQNTEQRTAAFTPEEKQQVLEALKVIQGQFGEQKAAPKQEAPKEQGKTVADVADKALDISTKYIGQVVGVLEKAAPHVWRVMVLQQYAKAIGTVIGPFLWLFFIPFLAFLVRYFWKISDRSSSDERSTRTGITLVIPGVAFAIASGFFISGVMDSAMYIINPEYYAIKDLITMLLHPGSM